LRISLWIAFLIRWAVTLLLLLLIAIDLGWILPAMLFIMSVAIEILARQIAGLGRDLRELRSLRQNLGTRGPEGVLAPEISAPGAQR
jgi:hypothetical protein